MIRIGICDDDDELALQLKAMISEINNTSNENISVSTFCSGKTMYEELEDHKTVFDIIFMDIMMPDMDGIDVGNKIREELDDSITQIVYISSQTNYAMQLFQSRPFDFLVKPFSKERVEEVVVKALKAIARGQKQYTFMTGRNRELIKIPYTKILYFQSHVRKIEVITVDHQTYEFYGKLDEVYKEVQNEQFLYIHKSYLVNYSQVSSMTYESVHMSDGTELSISPSKRKEIRSMYMQFEKQ